MKKALISAFPHTIPIFAGFWFLGMTYGIYECIRLQLLVSAHHEHGQGKASCQCMGRIIIDRGWNRVLYAAGAAGVCVNRFHVCYARRSWNRYREVVMMYTLQKRIKDIC